MKSIKVQLVAAIAMTMVAALTIGSSTYAWFSLNSSVSATGMKVSAVSGKNLVISTTDVVGGDEGTTKESKWNTVVNMHPASTSKLAGTQKFFRNSDDTATKVSYTSGEVSKGVVFSETTPATATPVGGGSVDVAKHTFYIRATDSGSAASYGSLYVSSISVVNGSSAAAANDISKALRVGVVCGSYGYIFAPVSGADSPYQAIMKAGTVETIESKVIKNASGEALSEQTTPASVGSTSIIADSVDTSYKTVDIYIWYEGQDSHCTSANAVNVEELTVSVTFVANNVSP